MKRISKRAVLVNGSGAVGYLLLLVSWLLCLVAIVPLQAALSSPQTVTVVAGAASAPSPTVKVASYVITIVMVLVAVAVLVALPYYVGRIGAKLCERTMRVLKLVPTRRNKFLLKSLAAALPPFIFLLFIVIFHPVSLTFTAFHFATLAVSVVAIALFFVQLYAARALNIAAKNVW